MRLKVWNVVVPIITARGRDVKNGLKAEEGPCYLIGAQFTSAGISSLLGLSIQRDSKQRHEHDSIII